MNVLYVKLKIKPQLQSRVDNRLKEQGWEPEKLVKKKKTLEEDWGRGGVTS
jgi:hypothetical protein